MGVLDWFGRRRREPEPPPAWHVYCEPGDIVAEDGRGAINRAPLSGMRSVRIVPLMVSRVGQYTPREA